jgi:hypothetical protein
MEGISKISQPNKIFLLKHSGKCSLLSLRNVALALLLFSSSHKRRMNLKNELNPPLASFGQALKYQWPRSNLAKSNQ